jgi:hypothetical protein
MGRAGFIAGRALGAFLAIIGAMFFWVSIAPSTAALATWFAFFLALFLWMLSGIAFYAGHRAKPNKPKMLGTYRRQ